MALERITADPDKVGGVPSIRSLRIPVATVVRMIAEGMAEQEILEAYPDLEREDIREELAALRRRNRQGVGSPALLIPRGVPLGLRFLVDNALSRRSSPKSLPE